MECILAQSSSVKVMRNDRFWVYIEGRLQVFGGILNGVYVHKKKEMDDPDSLSEPKYVVAIIQIERL